MVSLYSTINLKSYSCFWRVLQTQAPTPKLVKFVTFTTFLTFLPTFLLVYFLQFCFPNSRTPWNIILFESLTVPQIFTPPPHTHTHTKFYANPRLNTFTRAHNLPCAERHEPNKFCPNSLINISDLLQGRLNRLSP